MNAVHEDIGVLNDYEFDLAFGSDENDFTLSLQKHICNYGYYVYFEETEYGGIIDQINVDTSDGSIVYAGRTWHGMLEKKIICPDDGMDYLTLNGDANAVLGDLIERMDLEDIFEASDEESGIQIEQYEMDRFINGYSGICKMLESVFAKLMIRFHNGKVQLSAVPRIDYSQNDDFDSSQVEFQITKNDRPLNHIVCLGSGEMRKRHIIHLFADCNGGIRPYTYVDNPVEDSDYILDTSQQMLFGTEEVAETYDYPNVQAKENYVVLDSMPEGWEKTFVKYYEKDGEEYIQLVLTQEDAYSLLSQKPFDWDERFGEYFVESSGTYVKVESVSIPIYTVQETVPADWNNRFNDYFVKNNGNYVLVASVSKVTYSKLTKEPNDWKKSYGNYFYRYSDGFEYKYAAVKPDSRNKYILQTLKPSDWETGFGNYFIQKSNGKGFVNVTETGADNPVYKLQKQMPSDWSKNYADYFYLYSDGRTEEYKSVEGVSKYKYVLLTMEPSDWKTNFTSYYVKGSGYNSVSPVDKAVYTLQTQQPSDWKSNCTAYYMLSTDKKKYVSVSMTTSESGASTAPNWVKNTYYTKTTQKAAPKWKKATYYMRTSYYVAPEWKVKTYYTREKSKVPKWEKGKYYTKSSYNVAPAYEDNKYYSCEKNDVAPEWLSGKYYTKTIQTVPTWQENKYFRHSIVDVIPEFEAGVYYRLAVDNYAELVAGAIERMKEAADCDKLEIEFDPYDDIYDIGDVVGATDSVTGLSLWQPITKKIITIRESETKIQYKVGK